MSSAWERPAPNASVSPSARTTIRLPSVPRALGWPLARARSATSMSSMACARIAFERRRHQQTQSHQHRVLAPKPGGGKLETNGVAEHLDPRARTGRWVGHAEPPARLLLAPAQRLVYVRGEPHDGRAGGAVHQLQPGEPGEVRRDLRPARRQQVPVGHIARPPRLRDEHQGERERPPRAGTAGRREPRSRGRCGSRTPRDRDGLRVPSALCCSSHPLPATGPSLIVRSIRHVRGSLWAPAH